MFTKAKFVFVSVEIFYQPIDEMTMVKKWPLLTVWIEDATSSVLYEWRRGQQTDEEAEGLFVFLPHNNFFCLRQ
jgi:hypothetical protein